MHADKEEITIKPLNELMKLFPNNKTILENELTVAKQYEPKLYVAANAIFGASYDYTRAYRAFKEDFKKNKRKRNKE